MDQTPRTDREGRHSAPGASAEPAVEVDVARTGGFAGITRRWSAQPPDDEASDWIVLLDRCPWDEAPAHPEQGQARAESPALASPVDSRPAPDRAQRDPVADGFVWWIRARWCDPAAGPAAGAADRREAELSEDEVTGAWRDLVDAVRAWNSGADASRGAQRPPQ